MERHLAMNKNEIAAKIPEIEKSLSVVDALVKKQVLGGGAAACLLMFRFPSSMLYRALCVHLFLAIRLGCTHSVPLWLGARAGWVPVPGGGRGPGDALQLGRQHFR